MKWLLLSILLAVVLPINGHEKSTQSDGHQQASHVTAPAPADSRIAINQQTPQAQSNGTENDPQSYLSRLLSPENLPNIGLFAAGVVGILIAIGTLRAIKKQTIATVHSERAWVMVDLEKVPGMGAVTNISSRDKDKPERHFRSLNVRCVCSNQGQTAARIIEKRCAAVVINGDDDLPESPNLDIEIKDPVPQYLRANGDPWHGDWNIDVEVAHSESVQLLIIYGVVRYRHLFSSEIAQTTFGYSLSFDRTLKRLIGKPKYNENT